MKFPIPINSKTKIIAAVSGGPDSVYLLHQLLKHLPGKQIIVAHFNHNQRKSAGKADQQFTANLAKKLKLKFETATLKVKHSAGNLEDFLRQKRYRFLEEVRRRHKAQIIITAHHLGDQIETFFLNLSRGAAFSGLHGIEQFDSVRKIFRPFLSTSKKEILTFLKKHQIPYRLDQTNLNLKLTRNYLRHKILPLFEKINPAFQKTFGQSLEHLQNNLNLVSTQVDLWIKTNLKTDRRKLVFPLDNFLQLPEPLQSLIVKKIYQTVNQSGATTPRIKEILTVLHKNQIGLKKEFGRTNWLIIKKNPTTSRSNSKSKRIVVIETTKS